MERLPKREKTLTLRGWSRKNLILRTELKRWHFLIFGLLRNFIILVTVSKQNDEDDEGENDNKKKGDNDSNHDE